MNAARLLSPVLFAASLFAQAPADPLELGFRNPPEAAKPRTWWHWTASNISKEGITKDLEWMRRAGIGGFQLADVNAGSGQTVEKKILFGTPEWLDAVRHAASEAQRLGLEMTLFSSPGWSITGGPWVKPEQAMKKAVWSVTTVEGPAKFSGRLPRPPSSNGPIRNLGTPNSNDPTFYADTAVLAWRTLPGEEEMAALRPKITTSANTPDAAALVDDDLNSTLTLPATNSSAWILFEYERPLHARAFSIAARTGIPAGRLLASVDGTTFKPILELPGPQGYRGGAARTFVIPETTARFFKLELTGAPIAPAAVMAQTPPQPATQFVLAEAIVQAGARVHRWEEKAGFIIYDEFESAATPAGPASEAIPLKSVVNLTAQMDADGNLRWDVPAGRWTILRLGYSLTGAKNRPAVPSALGFEVDKLSRKHVEAYYHGYFDPISEALGPLYGKSLSHVLIDSWEAGLQNWTDDMIAEFRQRRGYDPTPYLPALSGRIVESAEASDRFLWDFRRTLADMFAEHHFQLLTELLHKRGITTYGEAAGVSLEIMEDTLLNKSKVDIPMGEFWARDLHPFSMYYTDVRGAASAGHVYAKPIVAAEAFTGGGYESPLTLKKIGDYWFSQGINRYVFHTSAHQPLDTKPGNTMVGTHLNRNITWAEQAQPYMTYVARASYLLQQGHFVADLAYLLREGAPSTMPFWSAGLQPAPPEGFDYDYLNTDALLHRITVAADGRLVLPDGMSYRLLILPEIETMTVPVLRKLRELVAAGATILGPRPMRTPGLTGDEAELRALADELWGGLNGVNATQRVYGKGRVFWGMPLPAVLASMKLARDFDFARPLDADLSWIHRRTGETDLYFLANRSSRTLDTQARFRVAGRQAELWHADTGAVTPAAYSTADGFTTVPLRLVEGESVFVVFRRPATAPSRILPETTRTAIGAVDGPWEVTFPAGLGAPARIQMPKLISWTAHEDAGVRYFSGTATYTRTLEAPAAWFRPGARVLLDLGVVKDIVEVTLNGRALATLWKPPYQADVTGVLRLGANQLELKVTNQWTNRIVGDRLVEPEKRVLGVPGPPRPASQSAARFGPQEPLESGLLGPVQLVSELTPPSNAPIAGIAVNYDESKVAPYQLPDPLVLANGKPVRDAKTWTQQRRPELLRLFEENQYGRAPGRPAGLAFDVIDKGTPAFDGKALRRQVTVFFSENRQGPKMDVALYLPAGANKPVPVLLHISFTANSSTIDDPGLKQGEIWGRDKKRVPAPKGMFGRLNVLPYLEKGFGVATVYYGDIDPDFAGGATLGVRSLYLKPDQTEPGPGEWGTIGAWAWGISRAIDYFETDAGVDARRIAILGVSRLGKTVMWAGASEPRVAAVIASCSGEGGAALSRRNYGETIAHLTAPTRYPYQFAANYGKYAEHPEQSPVEANLLVSLIAPRPVLLQTGDTDYWSDPKGEFLAAVSAEPVYRLFGKQGLGRKPDEWPVPGEAVFHDIGYYMHPGGHGTLPSDTERFIQFLEMHLKPGR